MIEHIAPKFAQPALVASESASPSRRRAAGLAYRAACRHTHRSTAKPRDAVHTPHSQVGPAPPTGVTWGRARPCAPLCRRLTHLTPFLHSESLPSAAIRRPKRSPSRFSSVASRSRSWRCSRPLQALLPRLNSPQNAAMSPISLTAITYFPDEFPISHNLHRIPPRLH